jgi:hypothetical protein
MELNITEFIKKETNLKDGNKLQEFTERELNILIYKALKEQLILSDVVVTLPSVKSKEFKRWTQSKGYEPTFSGFWYKKNNQTYSTDLLYRVFTNEIEFGN